MQVLTALELYEADGEKQKGAMVQRATNPMERRRNPASEE